MKRPVSPPESLSPRALNRRQAAKYVGLGENKFIQLHRDGMMPAPRVVGSRRLWIVSELDAAVAALPVEGAA